MTRSRPLDRVASIKVKLAVLVGTSVLVALLVSGVGDVSGVPAWLTIPVTLGAALGVTQWLARGMTAPLRDMTAAATRMASGDYSQRVVSTAADEVGQLARAFTSMAADLADVDRQRRQLIATVSHELRTPLTAQRALLENLVDGVVRTDDASLRSALAQAERLSSLVADLLDLSRIDGGIASLRLAPIDVHALLRKGIDEARMAGRDVRVALDVDPPDLRVVADEARIAQVIANLLDNAVRHSPAGGEVRVTAAVVDESLWELVVADDGPGIPADHATNVFTRFGTGDDRGGGTGIGLAIASWVCALHGGAIALLPPIPGRGGARVRAVLPRTPTLPTKENAVTSPAEPTTPTSANPPIPGASELTAIPTVATPGTSAGPRPGVPTPPVVDSLFGSFWPERDLAPQPGYLLGALAIGAFAALTFLDRGFGLAYFLVVLAAGGLVASASRRRVDAWVIASASICLSLAALLVVRSSEAVGLLAIVSGGLLLATTVTGARQFLAVLASPLLWVLAGLRGLPLLGRTITAAGKHGLIWPIVRTIAISLVALVLFGGLFASADALFGSWMSDLLPEFDWDSLTMRTFTLVTIAGVVLAGCYLALNPPRVEVIAAPNRRPVTRPWEWLVPTGLVVATFAGFLIAQGAAMWGGHSYLMRTTGLTYADYVHQGFGQLTVATFLTLFVVGIVSRKAPRETESERFLLRVVLATLCVLTLAVVASALYRMNLYQDAYGFTVLRLFVDGFELWLGLLVALVLVAGIRLSGSWLPRAAVLSGALFALAFGAMSPDAWVAQRNIDRYAETGSIDTLYLQGLGADAAPTIQRGLPADLAGCILASGSDRWTVDLLGWNLGRDRARDAVESVEQDSPGGKGPVDCGRYLTEEYRG